MMKREAMTENQDPSGVNTEVEAASEEIGAISEGAENTAAEENTEEGENTEEDSEAIEGTEAALEVREEAMVAEEEADSEGIDPMMMSSLLNMPEEAEEERSKDSEETIMLAAEASMWTDLQAEAAGSEEEEGDMKEKREGLITSVLQEDLGTEVDTRTTRESREEASEGAEVVATTDELEAC